MSSSDRTQIEGIEDISVSTIRGWFTFPGDWMAVERDLLWMHCFMLRTYWDNGSMYVIRPSDFQWVFTFLLTERLSTRGVIVSLNMTPWPSDSQLTNNRGLSAELQLELYHDFETYSRSDWGWTKYLFIGGTQSGHLPHPTVHYRVSWGPSEGVPYVSLYDRHDPVPPAGEVSTSKGYRSGYVSRLRGKGASSIQLAAAQSSADWAWPQDVPASHSDIWSMLWHFQFHVVYRLIPLSVGTSLFLDPQLVGHNSPGKEVFRNRGMPTERPWVEVLYHNGDFR